MINLKTKEEIEIMRKSCQLAANTLVYVEQFVKPGVTTGELNNICHKFITLNKAYPSPLNYHGFPKSVCTSRNEVICHGIPRDDESLFDGDILNIDVTTYLNNFHGDTNKTFLIGNVRPEIQKLVEVTKECLFEAIKIVKPGARLGDIGAIIQEIAHSYQYSVVREYCGHGIGREFHEAPQVVHYGKKGTGIEIKEGMTFTIEPMINLGTRNCHVLEDDWTVVTDDGLISAQFEHTIYVTQDGNEILTQPTMELEEINSLVQELEKNVTT